MFFGAEVGIREGLTGKTYAIPTKDSRIETLPLNEIKVYVDNFISFAKENPKYTFLVTKIGTGLAGLTIKEVAPLFKAALDMENVLLPQEFVDEIKA
jgi:hypothetical protein